MEIGWVCTIDTYEEIDITLSSETEIHFGISIITNYYSSNKRSGNINIMKQQSYWYPS